MRPRSASGRCTQSSGSYGGSVGRSIRVGPGYHRRMLILFLTATIALPGGPPVGMDYLAYDAAHKRVWVPAGNTGNIDVVDVATGKVTAIGGLATAPSKRPDR